ncbi:MAG: tetratricopeptide repeat protein [Bacteroidetes bacterium]|nr:tetratricopeptide repeat protein [Bacteroidota bacterium]
MKRFFHLTIFFLIISAVSKAQVSNILSTDTAFARKFKVDEYFNIDLTPEQRQHYKSEIEKLTEYIEKSPPDCGALINRGAYFSYLGFYVNAIRDYDAALALKSDFPEALYNRGVAKARFLYTFDSCKDIYKAKELGLQVAATSFENNCKRYTALLVKQ